jgi:U3 small nucleolar RNA-associated protein 7
VKEIIHDIKYLNAFQNVAIAQKHYVYLYDSQGIEVHCLKEHAGARKLEFLPQHMLLASVGKGGLLCYQDMTTGIVVSRNKTHDKFCDVMRQNPWSAVLGLGHTNGTVSMWTPNVSTPVIKMLCHRGPIQTMANDPTGNILVTSGIDCQIKVWDIRNLKIIHQYFSKNIVTSSEISQNGLLALASGNGIQIWKEPFTTKQHSPYMYYKLARGSIRGMAFCPYEDLLAFGHLDGIATIIIPGSGEPNFDSYAANPYRSTKSSKKIELRDLIEKLKPETIVLNPEFIGGMLTETKTINKTNTSPNTDVKRRRSNNSHKKSICNTFARIDKTQIKR